MPSIDPERLLAAKDATRGLAVDAVSFQDEESRFVGCLGSRSLIGALTLELEQGTVDRDGVKRAVSVLIRLRSPH